MRHAGTLGRSIPLAIAEPLAFCDPICPEPGASAPRVGGHCTVKVLVLLRVIWPSLLEVSRPKGSTARGASIIDLRFRHRPKRRTSIEEAHPFFHVAEVNSTGFQHR